MGRPDGEVHPPHLLDVAVAEVEPDPVQAGNVSDPKASVADGELQSRLLGVGPAWYQAQEKAQTRTQGGGASTHGGGSFTVDRLWRCLILRKAIGGGFGPGTGLASHCAGGPSICRHVRCYCIYEVQSGYNAGLRRGFTQCVESRGPGSR